HLYLEIKEGLASLLLNDMPGRLYVRQNFPVIGVIRVFRFCHEIRESRVIRPSFHLGDQVLRIQRSRDGNAREVAAQRKSKDGGPVLHRDLRLVASGYGSFD